MLESGSHRSRIRGDLWTGDLEESEFDHQPLLPAFPQLDQCLRHDVEYPEDVCGRQLIGDLLPVRDHIRRLINNIRQVRCVLDQEHAPEEGNRLGYESPKIGTLGRQGGNHLERRTRIEIGNCRTESPIDLTISKTEGTIDSCYFYDRLSERSHLFQQAHRVTDRATCMTGHCHQRLFGPLVCL